MDNGHEPATKRDIDQLRSGLRSEMADQETRVVGRLTEVIRDVQTELLKSFYGFTETVQTRFKAQDDTEAGLKKRLTVLEERILEIEKRLHMPSAA